MVQIGSQDRLSYRICLITCLETSHCPAQASSRLFAERVSSLPCLYISHCRFPSPQVLKVIRPLPAALQLQLPPLKEVIVLQRDKLSPACDKRSPLGTRIPQETPALPPNTPAFLRHLCSTSPPFTTVLQPPAGPRAGERAPVLPKERKMF